MQRAVFSWTVVAHQFLSFVVPPRGCRLVSMALIGACMAASLLTPTADVGVIGAGPAGLTLCHALRASGYSVRVFERRESFRPVGAAVFMHPFACNSLRAISPQLEQQVIRVHSSNPYPYPYPDLIHLNPDSSSRSPPRSTRSRSIRSETGRVSGWTRSAMRRACSAPPSLRSASGTCFARSSSGCLTACL